MKLSVELFQKTVQQLKGGDAGQRSEKRATPRVGLRVRIHLQPVREGGVGSPIDVWTRDISRVGLGIIHSRKLKVGDHYLLTLPHEDADAREKPLALYCTVKCCHSVAPDVYNIGLTFEDMRVKQFPAARPQEITTKASIPQVKQTVSGEDEKRIRNAILQ